MHQFPSLPPISGIGVLAMALTASVTFVPKLAQALDNCRIAVGA